ncbi:MAG: filamentous hemagglutinin N-terminal domain-containing protein [Alphaproteobacteria bacterium]|nr:filamentous hemagglutinin N-terminal domain-containing protein [Alphaproteobacteria bacterium]
MRHHSPRSGLFRRWLTTTTALAGVLPVLALTAPAARANPEGGSVVQGAATITQTNPKTVTVNQTTDKAVINWRSFSIGADETTRFNQPSSSSTTLNRVTGDQVSKILGNLSANGKVFLVNPNGIVFGAGSKIDVAALVASTADIKTENFMAGNLRFDIPGKVGAEIINQGTITAADGGLVALVSPVLRNSGIIQARLGKVALASANGVTLDLYGDNLILFQAADKITQQLVDTDGKPVNTAIDNSGQIYADGGRVLMTANTAKGVVDNAINTTGLVSARAVEQQGGEIVLKGEDGGNVQVAGRLDASGAETGQTGGRITVQGDDVTLADGASLDASGDAGGGKVTVGGWDSSTARMASGAVIDASAKTTGNGGEATVIAADTDVAGSIHAKGGENGGNGGMIETSGHFLRVANIRIDASARRGLTGQWLLDPYDLTVDADAASSISGSLNTGTNVSLLTTANGTSGPGNASSGNGDIIIASALGWTGSGNLSLSAYRNILIQAAVTHGGSGMLNMTPDNTDTGTGNVLTGSNGSVKLRGTGGLRISGNDYTLIRTVEQLQAMGLTGHYALADDIDATATAGWNNGEGFRPIGDSVSSFNNHFIGKLNGLGNSISNIMISNADADSVAIINVNEGLLLNISVHGASISGSSFAGGLTASNAGYILNSSVTGSVSGASYVGGLAASNQGTIIGGSVHATIDGSGRVGGLVGQNLSYGSIKNSYSLGVINGSSSVGGLVGYNDGSISDSFSGASVIGSSDVGGLVGSNSGQYAGGNLPGKISNSLSYGPVSGGNSTGGLVGDNDVYLGLSSGVITNSFWNTETTGQNTSSGGGTGLTTAQMNDPATFTNAGWDASFWNLTAGSAPTLKSVGSTGVSNGGSGSGGNDNNPGNGSGGDVDPDPTPNDNPLMGLDAQGLYATILSMSLADSYSTNNYWLEVKTANGGAATAAQIQADVMLNAWNRYKGYTDPQALANQLYKDVLDGYTVRDVVITNDPDNLLWSGSYGSSLTRSEGQIRANIMIQAYRKFGNASADEIFAALLHPTVTLTGITDPQPFTNSPTNTVWRGIYGADTQASDAQRDADHMMNVRSNLYSNASLLAQALRGGAISMDSLEWKALKDGWGTGTLYLSAVQHDALEIIRKQNAEERAKEEAEERAKEDAKDRGDKDNRDIERDRMIGIEKPKNDKLPYEEEIGTVNPFPILGDESLFGNQIGQENSGNGTTDGSAGEDANSNSGANSSGENNQGGNQQIVQIFSYLDTVDTTTPPTLTSSEIEQYALFRQALNMNLISGNNYDISSAVDDYMKASDPNRGYVGTLQIFGKATSYALKNLLVNRLYEAVDDAIGIGGIKDAIGAIDAVIAAKDGTQADKLLAMAKTVELLMGEMPGLASLQETVTFARDLAEGMENGKAEKMEAITKAMTTLVNDTTLQQALMDSLGDTSVF